MASRWASFAARYGASSSIVVPYAGMAIAAAAAASLGAARHDQNDAVSCSQCESASSPAKTPPQHRPATLQTRMTAVGRWSLMSETSSNRSIPVMVLALAGAPLTPQDFTRVYHERGIPARHPRFAARLNEDETHFTHEHKHKHANMDAGRDEVETEPSPFQSKTTSKFTLENVSETVFPTVYRRELMSRLEDAITLPIDLQKNLWEAKVCTGGRIGESGAISRDVAREIVQQEGRNNVESLLMFRAHHCLADGVSLGTIFADMMDESPQLNAMIKEKVEEMKKRRKELNKKRSFWQKLLRMIHFWWWGSIRAWAYQINLYLRQIFGPRNPWDVLKNEYEAQHRSPGSRQRHLSWVQMAPTEQVRRVAAHYSASSSSERKQRKVTVNDVIASCVSAAIAKQLEYHRMTKAVHDDPKRSKPLPELKQMNLVVPVHMQGGVLLPGQSLGNKIGALVCSIPAEMKPNNGDVPLSHSRLIAVHDRLSWLKQTPAAIWSFMLAKTLGGIASRGKDSDEGLFPWLFANAHAGASAVLTNVRGPDQPTHFDGRRVETSLGFLPLPPGIPIGVVVHSYAGRVTLTITAEPWAVPDADRFATWMVEEYKELLERTDIE